MSKDIALRQSAVPAWNPSDPRASLNLLAEHAEQQAKEAADWYNRGKTRKKWLSIVTRTGAILFTSLGGLIPVVAVLALPDNATEVARLRFHQWGYLSIGCAGVVLAFDRFYGGSSGWMRYISTLLSIETLIGEFRLDWHRIDLSLATTPNSPEVIDAAFARLRQFVLAVRGLVEKETTTWIAEFQSTLAQLEKQTEEAMQAAREQVRVEVEAQIAARKAVADAERPGAINLTVTGAPLRSGFDVDLDGRRIRSGMTGRAAGLGNVPPGLHELAVSGTTVAGDAVHTSQVVQVAPGQIVDATLAL
ncbi:SLATT domain-containing protein [Gemmatimonas sp.]